MQEGGGWATQWKRPRCHLLIMLLPPPNLIPVESCYIYKGLLHPPPSSVTWLPIPHYVSSKPEQPDSELQTFFSLPDRRKPGVHLSWQTGSTEHIWKADPDQGTELGHLNLTDIHSVLQHNSYAFRNHQEVRTQQDFFFPTQRPFLTFREFLCLS